MATKKGSTTRKKKPATTSSTLLAPRKETHLGTEEANRIYSNSLSLAISLYDFRFTFGEVLDATEETLQILDKAIINMSPQHAKSMSIVLAKHVKSYEDVFGPLPDAEEG